MKITIRKYPNQKEGLSDFWVAVFVNGSHIGNTQSRGTESPESLYEDARKPAGMFAIRPIVGKITRDRYRQISRIARKACKATCCLISQTATIKRINGIVSLELTCTGNY